MTLPATVQAQFTYTTTNGTITITRYTGSGGAVAIPSTVNGLPVTSIGQKAFINCTSLTSVTIPNTVTSIGVSAFENCSSLTSVSIGNSVTSIGDWAFYCCYSLANVVIPNSVTSIGAGAFYYCTGLTSVSIGNSVTSIGEGAFINCNRLTSVTIPNRVGSIGTRAFWVCARLTSVTFLNSYTSIGQEAFRSCTSLTGVYFVGDAPNPPSFLIFDADSIATVYYLPGTTGWGATFCGRPTALWITGSLLIVGPTNWQIAGSSVNLRVGQVANTRSFGVSGSLRLDLWATTSPYAAGIITGYRFASLSLNPLSAGYVYNNINQTLAYAQPPDGSYYVTLTLAEYDGASYVTVDYLNYTTRLIVGNPPSPPVANTASDVTTNGFTANWSAATGAAGYRLDVSTSSTFASYLTGYQGLDVGGALSRSVTGLSEVTTYYYRVRAYNGVGTSGNSSTVSVTTALSRSPTAPTANAASSLTSNSFAANWSSALGATGYRLDVSTNDTFSNYVAGYEDLDVGNVTSRSVNGLTATNNYYYRVRAYNDSGTSGSSETITCCTLRATLPAILVKGTYNGLFYESKGVSLQTCGFFTLSTTAQGKFSGKLQISGTRYSLSGFFDANGQAQARVAGRNASSLSVELQMDGSDRISGTVSDGTWTATLSGDRAGLGSSYAGNYTLVVPGYDSSTTLPGGDSFGSLKVDTKGQVKFVGTLADGTKVSQSTSLSKGGDWPLYVPLYSGSGCLMSWLAFASKTNSDLSGTLTWIKQAGDKSKYYLSGFTCQSDAVGSAYHVGNPILNLPTANIIFCGGSLASDITNAITIGPGNKVVTPDKKQLKLSFSKTTGTFKGSFLNPAGGKPLSFSGAVFQKLNTAYGVLFGAGDKTSEVYLAP